MYEFSLSPALPEDILALQQISAATFTETFAGVNTAENMQQYLSENLSAERLSAELHNPESHFFFAKDGADIIGYLKLNRGNAQTDLKDPRAVEIERIYVLQAYHGKKAGQLLFEKALEFAKSVQAEYVWLGVWEENKKAIAFYRKNGFTEAGTHIFRLGDDEQTDLIMKKLLDE